MGGYVWMWIDSPTQFFLLLVIEFEALIPYTWLPLVMPSIYRVHGERFHRHINLRREISSSFESCPVSECLPCRIRDCGRPFSLRLWSFRSYSIVKKVIAGMADRVCQHHAWYPNATTPRHPTHTTNQTNIEFDETLPRSYRGRARQCDSMHMLGARPHTHWADLFFFFFFSSF